LWVSVSPSRTSADDRLNVVKNSRLKAREEHVERRALVIDGVVPPPAPITVRKSDPEPIIEEITVPKPKAFWLTFKS